MNLQAIKTAARPTLILVHGTGKKARRIAIFDAAPYQLITADYAKSLLMQDRQNDLRALAGSWRFTLTREPGNPGDPTVTIPPVRIEAVRKAGKVLLTIEGIVSDDPRNRPTDRAFIWTAARLPNLRRGIGSEMQQGTAQSWAGACNRAWTAARGLWNDVCGLDGVSRAPNKNYTNEIRQKAKKQADDETTRTKTQRALFGG